MGRQFHNVKPNAVGFVEYNLSPFEQKAFGGLFSKEAIGNAAIRHGKNLWMVIPAFAYYKWAEYCFWSVEQGHRKKNLPEYESYYAGLKEKEETSQKKK